LPKTDFGGVTRHKKILVVTANLPEKLAVRRDVGKLIKGFICCWIGRLVSLAIYMDADQMSCIGWFLNKPGCPSAFDNRLIDRRNFSLKFWIHFFTPT
jgi:hypothetical protein